MLATVTWDGGGDGFSWNDAGNWDTVVPVDFDDVVIPDVVATSSVLFDSSATAVTLNSLISNEDLDISGSTLTLEGAGTFTLNAGLTFSGGTLGGTGDVTVGDGSGTDTFDWTGGSQTGLGTTTIGTSVLAGQIDGTSGTPTLSRTLEIGGAVDFVGGQMNFTAGTLTVLSGGNLTNSADGTFYGNAVGNSLNVNAGGTLTKTGAGTTLTLTQNTPGRDIPLNIDGTLNVTEGTLEVGGTSVSSTSSGAYDIDGTLRYVGGTHTVQAGAIIGGTGSIEFSGGTQSGTGTTRVTSGVLAGQIDGTSGTPTLARTLEIGGAVDFVGGWMYFTAGTLTVLSGGNLTNSADGTFYGNAVGNSLNVNAGGTLTKTGVGTTLTLTQNTTGRDIPLNIDGTLNVTEGTLEVGGTSVSSTSSGTYNIDGTLRYVGGTHTVQTGAVIGGTGSIEFSGGMVTYDDGSDYSVTTTVVNGGMVNFDTLPTTPIATTANLQMSGGTLAGAGVLEVTSDIDLTGGTQSGTGTTRVTSGVLAGQIDGTSGTPTLSRTLEIGGAVDFVGGWMYFTAGTLTVLSGGQPHELG